VSRGKTVCLVSCVSKKKRGKHTAGDIYDSTWFKKARNFVENNSNEWFILSAEHGLLHPHTIIKDYNSTMKKMPIEERKKWADSVLRGLRQVINPEDRVILLAGRYYREFLVEDLKKLCFRVEIPLEGMKIGEQLKWLSEQNDGPFINEQKIKNCLVRHGEKHLNSPREKIILTDIPVPGVEEANKLLNDIENYPHAYVLGCIMDRQIKAQRAWIIPYRIKERLGSFSMERLSKLSEEDVRRLMSEPEPLHRFVGRMSYYFYKGITRIWDVYEGNAANIWNDSPTSETLVKRFREFEGVGPKIANMAANILVRSYKIKLDEYSSIDISADVHVERVFKRLGLIPPEATKNELIKKARELHPEFPGIMDKPAWEIGKNWCKPNLERSNCKNCYMAELCVSAL